MRGNSFITILMFITVTGVLITSIVKLSHRYLMIEKEELIEGSLNTAYDSLLAFYSKNGYYPCPSPIDVSRDDKKFGKSANNCTSAVSGIDSIISDDGTPIASGGLPVRTLGLPDTQSFDSSNKRFLYSVSAGYTLEKSETYPQKAVIKLVDRDGNYTTDEKVIFTLIGFADENEGAYSSDGKLVEKCGGDSFFSENCDKDDTFTHSALNIDIGTQAYTSKIRYKGEVLCRKTANVAERVGFLLDTSGSMTWAGICPPDSKDATCTRMKGALWALHNALTARLIQAKTTSGLFTGFSGFTGKINQNEALAQMTDIEISSEQDIQNTIYQICPIGGTPLGSHLWAMAEIIGDGTPDRPNIITIISDGANTEGVGPNEIADGLKIDKPNLRVNIIDVANNPSSEYIATVTGGTYYKVSKPDDLMKAIYKSMGACFDDELPMVSGDQKYCKPPEPPPPPEPPITTRTVKVSLVVKIIVPNPVYVSGYSREEVAQALKQALEAAEAEVSEQLSNAISEAISDALTAFDNGASIPATQAAIKQAFDDALDVAMNAAVDSANQKIDNMPVPVQAPIRNALVKAVDNLLTQFDAAIGPYIVDVLDTGEMPPLVLTTVGNGAVVIEDP